MGSFNYFIDPGNIFKFISYEKQISDALVSGSNVGFTVTMSQVDEVKLLKNSIANFKTPVDALMLGSSRAFPIHKGLFVGYSYYNASISASRLGDILAIYNLFEKKNLSPKGVVISVDPDFFVLNPLPRGELWNEFVELSEKAGMKIGFHKKIFFWKEMFLRKLRKSIELFSPAYFQDSLKVLLLRNFGFRIVLNSTSSNNFSKRSYYTTFETHARGGVLFPDGSREFADKERLLKGDKKSAKVASYILNMERIKTKSFAMRKDSIRIFESFVHYLLSKNIRVMFILIPEHSMFYDYEKYINLINPVPPAVEGYVLRFAQQNKVKVLGSYEIAKSGFTDDDMVDHHHPKRVAITKIRRVL